MQVRGRYGEIIEVLGSFNVSDTYKKVREALAKAIPEDNTSRLRTELEHAARMTFLSSKLVDLAQRELDSVKDKYERTAETWRQEGLEYYEHEKAEGRLKKQITKDMIDSYARKTRPEAWQTARDEVADAQMVLSHVQSLHTAMRERSWNLRALVKGFGESDYEAASREAGRGRI